MLKLLKAGHELHEIAERMSISIRTARNYCYDILKTDTLFPSSLSPEEVARLRQQSGVRIMDQLQSGHEVLQLVRGRMGSESERNMDATATARLMEASGKLEERLSKLYGLDQPTKIVEEQTRASLEVLIQSSDKGLPMLSWDRSFMEKPVGSVPGLTIYEGCRLSSNGNTEEQSPELQDSASD